MAEALKYIIDHNEECKRTKNGQKVSSSGLFLLKLSNIFISVTRSKLVKKTLNKVAVD